MLSRFTVFLCFLMLHYLDQVTFFIHVCFMLLKIFKLNVIRYTAGLEFVFLFQFYRNDIMVSNHCNKVKFLLLFLYKDLYSQGSPLNVWQHLTGLGWVFFCQSSYWMYLHRVHWYHRSFCSYHCGVCRLMEENLFFVFPGLPISFPSLTLLHLCKTESSGKQFKMISVSYVGCLI